MICRLDEIEPGGGLETGAGAADQGEEAVRNRDMYLGYVSRFFFLLEIGQLDAELGEILAVESRHPGAFSCAAGGGDISVGELSVRL